MPSPNCFSDTSDSAVDQDRLRFTKRGVNDGVGYCFADFRRSPARAYPTLVCACNSLLSLCQKVKFAVRLRRLWCDANLLSLSHTLLIPRRS